jgi:hypothetical protein
MSLNQTRDLSNPINECERDKFTRQSFLFLDESEKSLNQTRWGVSSQYVMGEAKAPVQDFYERSTTYESLTQAWENPKLSKSRRINC